MHVVSRIAYGRFLAHLWMLKGKPLKINTFRGFLVDKRFEISNLELLKDMAEVVEFVGIS